MYIKHLRNAIVPNPEVTRVRQCWLRGRQGVLLRLVDKRCKGTCMQHAIIFDPSFSLSAADYKCTASGEVCLFMCPQGVAVCRLGSRSNEDAVSVSALQFERPESPEREAEERRVSEYAVLCLTVPLFRDVRADVRLIHAETISVSSECVAVLGATAEGFVFELCNFRQRGTSTVVLSHPCESAPVSFFFGWDSLNERHNDPPESLNGETFELLLEFLTLTVCFQDGSCVEYVPVLPSCSDLHLPPIYQKCLSFLNTFAEGWTVEGLTYDAASLSKISATLASIGAQWSNHAKRFRSVDLSSPSDKDVCFLVPSPVVSVPSAETGPACAAPPFNSRLSVTKALSVHDGVSCLVRSDATSADLLFFAMHSISGITDSDLALKEDIGEFATTRVTHRELVRHEELDFAVHDACVVEVDRLPVLVLVNDKETRCVRLSWILKPNETPGAKVQRVCEYVSGRSVAVAYSTDGTCSLEVWSDDSEACVSRYPLSVTHRPDTGSTSRRLEQPQVTPRRPYYSWLERTCQEVETASHPPRFLQLQSLETLMQQLKELDNRLMSPIGAALQKLGAAGPIKPDMKYPGFLRSRLEHCMKLLDVTNGSGKSIRDTNTELNNRVERAVKTEGEIEAALQSLRDKMFAAALQLVVEKQERHVSPWGGPPLGSGLGLLRDVPLNFPPSLNMIAETPSRFDQPSGFLPLTAAAGGYHSLDMRFGPHQSLRRLEQATVRQQTSEAIAKLQAETRTWEEPLKCLRDTERSTVNRYLS